MKNSEQLDTINGLIIPGGESTTIFRLLNTSGMIAPIIRFYKAKQPIFGTCAGLILLSKSISSGGKNNLGLMDIVVERNSFGRQVDSFETNLDIKDIGKDFPAVFIRAPHIAKTGKNVTILAKYNEKIVMVRENNLLACSFHPELTDDNRVTEYFVTMVSQSMSQKKK